MTFEQRYNEAKEQLLSNKDINHKNRELFKKFFEWEEEKLKRTNDIQKIDEPSYKTLYGYISKLQNVNNWFKNKAWEDLSTEEIKKVYNDLEDGEIKNYRGEPFKDRRSYYNKIFKAKPFQLAGLRDKVEESLEFFTDKKKPIVCFINKESFLRAESFLTKPQHKVLFWLAWDVGENISSLLELRKKDLKRQINENKEPEYLVYLRKDTLKRSRETRSEPTIFPETTRYIDALLEYGKEIEYRDPITGQFKRKVVPFKDDDFLFSFKYRQALQIFDSVVKRSAIKCEPTGDKPQWKDLRSGMACNLFTLGWHVEDINLRLGHSPQSNWLKAYINYLAINRKRAVKQHYQSNLTEIKEQFEEVKQREKAKDRQIEEQSEKLNKMLKDMDMMRKLMGEVIPEIERKIKKNN